MSKLGLAGRAFIPMIRGFGCTVPAIKMCRRDRALDMGLVNKVVPLDKLEDEYVQWAEEMMLLSPLALRMIKAGLNAELDGQAGIQAVS